MARSRQSPPSRFAANPSSRFNSYAQSGITNGYWATSSQTTTGRTQRRRPISLGSDILAPLDEQPRYYALAWQILLWLAFTVLALIMVFG